MELDTSKDFKLPSQLKDSENILIHLSSAAVGGNQKSFVLLQESLNHLSQKVRNDAAFDDHEKNFLKVIFTCPWWGGKEHGLNEARRLESNPSQTNSVSPVSDSVQLALAQMARHYVEGAGQYYPLNLAVYRGSSIVRDTVNALRDYICELYTYQKPATVVSTTDGAFLKSKYAARVESVRRHSEVKGFIFKDGTLMLDQKDPRLITLGNRFRITALTSSMGSQLATRWRLEGTYQFENFTQGDAETGLPLNDHMVLSIPSCLGVHLVTLGVAKPFDYFADWTERYPLVDL